MQYFCLHHAPPLPPKNIVPFVVDFNCRLMIKEVTAKEQLVCCKN